MRTSKRTSKKQRGLSAIGALGALFIAVAVATLVLRLGPHYMSWRTMQHVFDQLPAEQVHTMKKQDIRKSLKKRFRVNYLRDFDLAEIVTIDREKTETTLTVSYEKRESIVANLDAVLTFSEQYRYQ